MYRHQPFERGAEIVWRSRPGGAVGYVFGCRVVLDEPDVAVVVQPKGSPISRRVAQRGGPNGRSLLPGSWDGSRQSSRWDRPPCVRLHPVGRSYSVIRTWSTEEGRFEDWYVNLEQPWVRTQVGFDSRDDVLDVTVSEDLSACQLKDADELEFAIDVGLFRSQEARAIHVAARSATDDIARRWWPFHEQTWSRAIPRSDLEPTELPPGWETL